ncbi:MAG: ACP S-malonyltransferase [Dehalococcoidia bacterium]|nr:ACP S-malonyltransferase [Dehalococcoidia bacterium]
MTHSKIAYVFPGQGSQAVGMGQDIYSRFPSAKAVYDIADEALGFSLSGLCFEGPEEELTKTINVQPAVMITSLAYLNAAREQAGDNLPPPDFMAGHSLGLYTALAAAEALSLTDAVKLVRERGRLMYEAGQSQPGSMMAVVGADNAVVDDLCRTTGVQVSNLNSPGQVVVSGTLADLDEFTKQAGARGIRRMISLKVSGAFHSRLMQPAAEGLKKAVNQCQLRTPKFPVISNVTAEVLGSTGDIKSELIGQITSCVLWQKSVENMAAAGVSSFYEIGHGQVLSGLIKRIKPDLQIIHAADLIKVAS